MSETARQVLGRVAAMVFPPSCIACHRALGPKVISPETPAEGLCPECLQTLHPLDIDRGCFYCGAHPLRLEEGSTLHGRCLECSHLPGSFTQARSAFPYQSPAGDIVRNLKYHRTPYLAQWLANLAIPVVAPWLKEVAQEASVMAVPMSLSRELHRGYNQAFEIARHVALKIQRPMLNPEVFLRTKKSKPQARFHSREERLDNLKGIYTVRKPDEIRGQRILLVDDVMTSGATVSEAAQTLLDGGASEIYVFTPVRARLKEHDDVELAR
jgi:ComF family protein